MPKPTLEQFYRAAGQPLPRREWIDEVQRALALEALSDNASRGELHLLDGYFVCYLHRDGPSVYPASTSYGLAMARDIDGSVYRDCDTLTQLVMVCSSRYADQPAAWFTKGTRCIVPKRLLPGDYLSRRDPTQVDCVVTCADICLPATRAVMFVTSTGEKFVPPVTLLEEALRNDEIQLLG